MMSQVVCGIIRSANDVHAKLLHNGLRRESVSQCLVCVFPNLESGVLVERLCHAEITLQLQMSPVINRITKSIRNGSRPLLEFVVGRSVAGAEALGNSIGAHGAPFVVVAFEPDFREVRKAAIRSNVGCAEVGMIVDDWLQLGVLMVESARGLGVEEEIVVEEGSHETMLSGFAAQCKKQLSVRASETELPPGLKPVYFYTAVTARLKPCPFKTDLSDSFQGVRQYRGVESLQS